jgi:hypothetical protein
MAVGVPRSLASAVLTEPIGIAPDDPMQLTDSRILLVEPPLEQPLPLADTLPEAPDPVQLPASCDV